MTNLDKDILDKVSAWFVRLERDDASLSDWEAFTAWLEESPDHAPHYDIVVESDGVFAMSPLLASEKPEAKSLQPANDNTPRWYATIAAAAAVLVAAFWLWPSTAGPDFQRFETAPGESQQIALDGNTSVNLNGGSEILVDMAGRRQAKLISGEALFTVEHDAQRPFIVELGAERLVDAGTMFNVTREDADYWVSVAEGKVVLNPDSDAVAVMPGERLAGAIGSRDHEITALDASLVGGWMRGELSFTDAPVSQVASELERNFGISIAVDDQIRDIRFTGTLQIKDGEQPALQSLAGLTGTKADTAGDGWQLSP